MDAEISTASEDAVNDGAVSLPVRGGGRTGGEAMIASTGMPAVDRMVQETAQVHELSVAERVAVFERVHEQLRRSLDADPESDPTGE